MKPAYQPASADELSSNILQNLHNEFEKSKSNSSSEGSLLIQRKDVQDSYDLLTFIHTPENKLIHLKTANISHESFTWSDQVLQAKKLAKEKFTISIYASILNDDLYLVETDELEKMWLFKCSLCFSTSIEDKVGNSELVDQAQSLLEKFSTPELNKLLVENGGTLIEPEKKLTHHYQAWSSLSTCLNNLSGMSKLIGEKRVRLRNGLVHLVMTDTFEERLKYFKGVLDPIISIINKCEKSGTTMVDIIQDWLALVSCEKYSEIKSDIKKILTQVALAPNKLHPIYRGKHFKNDNNYNTRVMEFLIDEVSEAGIESFVQYQEFKGIFSNLAQFKNPLTFWKVASSHHPQLATLAIKLLQLPASLPQLDCYQTNSIDLTPEQSAKISDLFHSLNV